MDIGEQTITEVHMKRLVVLGAGTAGTRVVGEGMTLSQNKTDHQLKVAISDEFTCAPNVKADHVGVSIADGAVTLSGEVESYPDEDRRRASGPTRARRHRHRWSMVQRLSRTSGAPLLRSR